MRWANKQAQLKRHKVNPKRNLIGRYKFGSRTKLAGGINKRRIVDKYGRPGWYYVANLCVGGNPKQKRFSISRLGEDAAKKSASLWRLWMLVDMKVWNPKDGDPIGFLSYADSFSGNKEYEAAIYEAAIIADTISPYTEKYVAI